MALFSQRARKVVQRQDAVRQNAWREQERTFGGGQIKRAVYQMIRQLEVALPGGVHGQLVVQFAQVDGHVHHSRRIGAVKFSFEKEPLFLHQSCVQGLGSFQAVASQVQDGQHVVVLLVLPISLLL